MHNVDYLNVALSSLNVYYKSLIHLLKYVQYGYKMYVYIRLLFSLDYILSIVQSDIVFNMLVRIAGSGAGCVQACR